MGLCYFVLFVVKRESKWGYYAFLKWRLSFVNSYFGVKCWQRVHKKTLSEFFNTLSLVGANVGKCSLICKSMENSQITFLMESKWQRCTWVSRFLKSIQRRRWNSINTAYIWENQTNVIFPLNPNHTAFSHPNSCSTRRVSSILFGI